MFKRRLGQAAGVVALAGSAVLVVAGPSQAAGCYYDAEQTVPLAGSITNDSEFAIGVVHLADGVCGKGAYDAILQPGQDTYHTLHWTEAAAAWIGSDAYEGAEFAPGRTEIGPSQGPSYLDGSMDGGNWTVVEFTAG